MENIIIELFTNPTEPKMIFFIVASLSILVVFCFAVEYLFRLFTIGTEKDVKRNRDWFDSHGNLKGWDK